MAETAQDMLNGPSNPACGRPSTNIPSRNIAMAGASQCHAAGRPARSAADGSAFRVSGAGLQLGTRNVEPGTRPALARVLSC